MILEIEMVLINTFRYSLFTERFHMSSHQL